VTGGRLEQRIKQLLNRPHKIPDDVLEIVEEAKRAFPSIKSIVEAKTMVEKHFDKHHAFSKRYVQKVLTDVWDAQVTWFGQAEDTP